MSAMKNGDKDTLNAMDMKRGDKEDDDDEDKMEVKKEELDKRISTISN